MHGERGGPTARVRSGKSAAFGVGLRTMKPATLESTGWSAWQKYVARSQSGRDSRAAQPARTNERVERRETHRRVEVIGRAAV